MIKLRIGLVILLVSLVKFANSQTKIIGKVYSDQSNVSISSATVLLNSQYYTTTNKNGRFEFNNIKSDSITIKISHIGFVKFEKKCKIDLKKKKNFISTIKLKPDVVEIGEIKIKGKGVLEVIKGDTTEYNVRFLKMDKYDSAKELVEAIPGVYRDANGNLIAKGKRVKIVTIDGKHLYKGKVDENLESLPADLIHKVQIFEDYDELAKFCGFDMGYKKYSSINLVTKYPKLKLALGDYAGLIGTKDRYLVGGNNTFLLKNTNINIKEHVSNTPKNYKAGTIIQTPKDYLSKGIKSAYALTKNKFEVYADGEFKNNKHYYKVNSTTEYLNEPRKNISLSDKHNETTCGFFKTTMDFNINKKNKLFFENFYKETQHVSDSKKQQKQELDLVEILNSNFTIKRESKKYNLVNEMISRSLLNPNLYLQFELKSDYNRSQTKSQNKGFINGRNYDSSQFINQTKHDIKMNPIFVYKKNHDQLFKFNNSFILRRVNYDDSENTYALNYLINTFKIDSDFSVTNFFVNYNLGVRTVKSVNSDIEVLYNTFIGSLTLYGVINKYEACLSFDRSTQTPKLQNLYDFYSNENPLFFKLGNKDLKQAEVNNVSFSFNKKKYSKLMDYKIRYSFVKNYIVNTTYIVKNSHYLNKDYVDGSVLSKAQNVDGYWNLGGDITINFYNKYELPLLIFLNYTRSNIPNYYNEIKNTLKSHTYSLRLDLSNFRNKYLGIKFSSSTSFSQYKGTLNLENSLYISSVSNIDLIVRKFLKGRLKINYNNSIDYFKLSDEEFQVYHYLNIDFRVPLLKSKIDLSIIAKDMLNNGISNQKIRTKDFYTTKNSALISRLFLLKLSYKFMNTKVKNRNRFKFRKDRRMIDF